MSETPTQFAFPHRTPIFTTVLVLVLFALFGWLAMRVYVPRSQPDTRAEGVKSPAERKALLAELHAKEHAAATTYGWVDQQAGVVRLPIDRGIDLVVKEHAKN